VWLLFIAYGFLAAAVLGLLCIRFYDHYRMKEGRPRALTATKAPVSEAPQVNSRTSPASHLSSLIAGKAQSRVFTNPPLVEHAHSQRTVLLDHSVSATRQVAFADASPAPSAQPQASATPTPYSTVKKPNFFKRLFNFILRALGVAVPSPPPQNGLQPLEFSSTNSTTPATNLTLRCSRETICAVRLAGHSSDTSQPIFRVTNGTIRSERGIMIWDLSNVKSGTYTAEMQTFDGLSLRRTLTVECFDCNPIEPTPTPTPRLTPTPVSTPISTPSPASTPISTPTPVVTPSPLSTPSPASTPTPMATPSRVATLSPRSTHARAATPTAKATPSPYPPTPTPTPPTPLASPQRTKETDYANKSWPEKLPKNWRSQITVEFRRTYGPTEYPTPSNLNGNISRPIVLPIIPGGEGNPDNELYEASASIEVPDTGDIEVFSKAEFKSLDGQDSVTWTIPFKQKNNVTERANFHVVFKVQLRNKRTGELKLTPYDLGQETIIVDWIPGTRGSAYLLFVVFFPFSFGMISLSKKAQESAVGSMPTEDVILHANLWIEDIKRRRIPSPHTLQLRASYFLLFAIEPRVRDMLTSTQSFVEPPEFRENSASDVKIQVVSSLLKNELGHETRDVKYHSGIGFAPETFDLATPEEEGHHFVTVRLFFRQTIIFRERIRVEVKSVARAARA
jgi:hypothetical protein